MGLDLKDKMLNNLKFVSPTGDTTSDGKHKMWECLCVQCGAEHVISSRNYGRGVRRCKCTHQIKVGQLFGRLTVIETQNESSKHGKFCECECDCGERVTVRITSLIYGERTTCGNHSPVGNLLHGLTDCPENKSWSHMKYRCFNENSKNYEDYGGRGITVCDGWSQNFENFYRDMGERPEPKSEYSIDRIDNNLNYSCGKCSQCIKNKWGMNCRWATKRQQSRNTRKNNDFIGVRRNHNKYTSRITVNGKEIHLGSFDTKEDAARAYDDKNEELWGDRPNATSRKLP